MKLEIGDKIYRLDKQGKIVKNSTEVVTSIGGRIYYTDEGAISAKFVSTFMEEWKAGRVGVKGKVPYQLEYKITVDSKYKF